MRSDRPATIADPIGSTAALESNYAGATAPEFPAPTAGRCMDFEQETPDSIATAIAETIGQSVDYRPVESDGAARAAALIAPLLEEGKGRRPPPRPRRSTAN
jgi:hypothetical protein